MGSNRRTACHVRGWGAGVGVAGGAAVTAVMIGLAGAPTARADTGTVGDVLGQAIADLSQYDYSQLFSPDNPSLTSAFEVIDQGFFMVGQIVTQGVDADIAPNVNQANPLLLDAANELLSADQTLINSDVTTPVALFANDLLVQDAAKNMSNVLFAELFAAGAANTGSGAASTVDTVSVPDMATASVTTAGTSPADLLSEATTNYTDANQLLAELPSSASAYAPAVATEIKFQDSTLQSIGWLESAESSLSSYDNGALSDLVNPWFTSVDQGWQQASEAALNADQAVENAVATGSATDIATAMLGMSGPEYQALVPDFQSGFVDLADKIITGMDPMSAGLNSVSAIDPGIFADLLSSIGL